MKRLVLIDGSSLSYRSYYAFINNPLKTSKGEPTSAIFGFARAIKKISRELKPDYAAVCFDLPHPTFRKEEFSAYKAHRKKTPEDLVVQLPYIKELCEAAGFPVITKEGYEADDIIATLVEQVKGEDLETIIFTLDKDLTQLVSDKVKVLNMHKSEEELYDRNKVEEKFGVPPEKIKDLLALSGDSSDNIPGIKGIGEKTAASLLKKFGSLENIFLNIEEIENSAIRNKLKGKEEEAKKWKSLIELNKNVPIQKEISELKYRGENVEKLRSLLQSLEFYSLIKEWVGEIKGRTNYQIVSSLKIKKEYPLCVYLEPIKNQIFVSSGEEVEIMNKNRLRESIKEGKETILVTEDVKRLAHLIGFYPKNEVFDLSIAHYLLYPNRRDHSLPRIMIEEGLNIGPSEEISVSIYEVYVKLKNRLEENELLEIYKEIEKPLIPVLFKMEENGILVDKNLLEELKESMEKELKEIEQSIYRLAGVEFNIRSPKQLREILFGRLGLPPLKKIKTGFSTDLEVLSLLSSYHSIVPELINFRELDKLITAYIIPLINSINKENGRIHPEFQQTVAATGRLTTINPNLQTLPIRTEKGKKIREAVIAPKECQILSCDYSQIELRILAYLSKDEKLIEDFENNLDIHLQTASRIFGIEGEKVSEELRRRAKAVNFGIIYGISPFGLSKQLGITNLEASAIIEKYYASHPGVAKWQKEIVEKAMERGFVKTIFGRKRLIPELKNPKEVEYGKRIAINTPIQGSAADIIKKAMIEINKELEKRELKTKMILQIHDELLFEVPSFEKEEVKELVISAMENAGKVVGIPLKVDYSFGKNWNEAH
ncbi:MAG: DNA polymerase I [candidate division WOR-3 bacterium]